MLSQSSPMILYCDLRERSVGWKNKKLCPSWGISRPIVCWHCRKWGMCEGHLKEIKSTLTLRWPPEVGGYQSVVLVSTPTCDAAAYYSATLHHSCTEHVATTRQQGRSDYQTTLLFKSHKLTVWLVFLFPLLHTLCFMICSDITWFYLFTLSFVHILYLFCYISV